MSAPVTPPIPDRPTSKLRRWPPFLFLVVAGVFATFLPSALRTPQTEPQSEAEISPGAKSRAEDPAALGSGQQTRATLERVDSRCTGVPARQTEDPMSPRCRGGSAGDNGGATAPGVTGTEVRVVLLEGCRDDGSFDVTDYDQPAQANTPEGALVRAFNARFQLHGRRVHLFAVRGPVSCAGHVQWVVERLRPFWAFAPSGLPEDVAEQAARLDVVAAVRGGPRATAERNAPFLVSFAPDVDDVAANVLEAVCARLADRPARFAGDAGLRPLRRTFGLVYDQPGTSDATGAGLIVEGIRRRCGEEAGEVVVGAIGGSATAADAVARMQASGVTTVLYATADRAVAQEADARKWSPEFFVVDDAVLRNADARQFPPAPWRSAFGITSNRRLPAPADQYHRKAYADACPGCPGAPTESLYNELLFLFTGIQVAGPRLTAAQVDRGLRDITPYRSADPYAPSAFFVRGNHSFVKDFAMAWWDPAGVPPGGSTPGCWRLVEDGRRYRAGDWSSRPGDDGVHGEGQPCQGDA